MATSDRDWLAEARAMMERAEGGLNTLHLGPLDYNVTMTADDLRTAAALLEEYLREQQSAA